MNISKTLLTSAACVACALPFSVQAETTKVTTQTIVEAQDVEGINQIDFSAFDTNKDGIYSKPEVGEKLFYSFDRDGNEVIDNIEWDRKSVFTITPMEQETYKFVDYNDDGTTEVTTYTYNEFYKESALILFDKNKDGLSASEFINVGFQKLDLNDNNVIELNEWKKGYIEMTKPENAEQERYN
ncbi:MAG: hypothetical protein GW778_07465 [Alphaproteobacteria bacterium]|nr:hypothetical protein [Alphaproteobacteria bacterium]